MRPWKCYCVRIAFLGKLIYLRPSRISKSYRSCDLIECLSCRIIPCAAYYLILTIILYYYEMCMSS